VDKFSRKPARFEVYALLLAFSLLFCLPLQSNAQTITTSQQGTNNGYFYSFWRSTSSGSLSMTLGSGGNYAVSWSNFPGDFTCGKGWNPGGYRTVGYNCGYYSNSGGGSLAVYGWTTGPLVEYYINEMWSGSAPGGTYVGTVNTDGATYNIYKHQQVNQPSIQGTATFWQYISTRQSPNSQGQNHTVTTGNHFNAWASHGMNLGNFNYMILLTEGWNGSGYVNATVW
jgi:endo-1,4-beta-xylanase